MVFILENLMTSMKKRLIEFGLNQPFSIRATSLHQESLLPATPHELIPRSG